MKNSKINLYGAYVSVLAKQECFDAIFSWIEDSNYRYQISLNVAKLVFLQKDIKLKEIINFASIVNADGMPIKILAQKKTGKNIDRLGGYDYIEGLISQRPDIRYYFWGGKEDVVKKVVEIYKEKYRANIVGYHNGYEKNYDVILDDMNEKRAQVFFIGMGSPIKEYILYDYRDKFKANFGIGVGGAFDVIAGKTRRAPLWMQNAGLEWLYRIYQEPRRMLKRYAVTNTIFIWMLLKEMIRKDP